MRTCFVVHNPEVARALRSHLGPDARVVTPPENLGGFAIDRLIMVDAPPADMLATDRRERYETWVRDGLVSRLTPGAKLVGVPEHLRQELQP